MVNKKSIIQAWKFLRENNQGISDETLDFMRDAAIEKLNDEGKDIYDSIYMKVIQIVEKGNVEVNSYKATAEKLKSLFTIRAKE